jgi:chemotaxis response regulator CheB
LLAEEAKSSAGVRRSRARRGAEALKPDVVVLDISMPIRTGSTRDVR